LVKKSQKLKGPCTHLRPALTCAIQAASSGKANLQHRQLSCYRCYLPVLTGFTGASLRRTPPSSPLTWTQSRQEVASDGNSTPLERVVGYRAPLAPHLARSLFSFSLFFQFIFIFLFR